MNENLDAPASAAIHTIASPAAHGAIGTLQSLSLRSMFWRPAYFKDSPWLEHLPFAFWLIEAIRPRVFVEVGVDAGVSYFAFCQAVERLRLDTRCYAVHGENGEAVFDAIHAHNEGQYAAFSRLLRIDFDGARGHFAAGSIDLLHLNGAVHDVEEFEAWLPKLSERAVVLVHGIEARDADSGIPRLFSALKRRYPHFEFVQGDGLGVLGAGPGLSTLAQQLFEAHASEPMRQAVQEVFARLGRACADQHAAATQLTRAQDFASQVAKQQKQLDEVKQSLDKTKADLNNRSKELTDARTRLQTQLEQHAVERGQLAERVSLLQEIRGELKDESARLQAQIDSARAELARRFEEIKALAIESAEHKAHVATARSTLESREAELGKSQEALERTRAELADAVKARQAADEQQAAAKAADVQRLAQVTQLTAELRQAQEAADAAATREAELRRVLSGVQHSADERERLGSQAMATLRQQLQAEQAALAVAQRALQAAADETAEREAFRHALQALFEERGTVVEGLKVQLASHAAELQRSAVALGAFEEAGRAAEDRERDAHQEIATLRQQLQAEQAALAAAQRALQAAAGEAARREASQHALLALFEERDAMVEQLKAQAASQGADIQRAGIELAASREAVRAKDEALTVAHGATAQAQAELGALLTSLRDRDDQLEEAGRLRAENEQLQSKLQERFDETAKLTAMVVEQERLLRSAQQREVEQEGLARQVAQLRAQLEAHAAQREGDCKALRAEQEEIEKVRAECAALQVELKNRERELAGRVAEASKQAEEIARQQAANTNAQASLQARFAETAKLTGMVAELEQKLSAQRASHEALRAESDRKNKALREAETFRERLSADLAAARQQTAVQRERLQSLKQTTSWKLTAPLRLAARPFRRSRPASPVFERELQVLRDSGLFDAAWYMKRYPDVGEIGMDPLAHYLRFGAVEGRDPGPRFSTAAYVAAYPDVATSGGNALLHYVEHGRREGRVAVAANE